MPDGEVGLERFLQSKLESQNPKLGTRRTPAMICMKLVGVDPALTPNP